MLKKGLILMLMITLFIGLSNTVLGSDWPNDPIRIVVGYGAGGSTDTTTRFIASKLEEKLGVNVIVENKPGGAGTLAATLALMKKPDGNHIVTLPTAPALIAPHMLKDVTFNPAEDFTHISTLIKWRYALVVRADAPWETFEDVIKYAKENPGKFSYSNSGVGNSQGLVMNYLADVENIDWKEVPYKGSGEAAAALVGGHVDAQAAAAGWLPLAEDGQVRPIVVMDAERDPSAPEVPTLLELGYDIVAPTVLALAAPAGVPEERVKILEEAIEEIVNTQEYKDLLVRFSMILNYKGSKETKEFIQSEYKKVGEIIKNAGIGEIYGK